MGEAVVMGQVGQSMASRTISPSFEEYVAAHGRALWRSAWLLTGDAQRAEDLVQTALLKCWRRWDSIARADSIDAYVRRVLVNTYTDWWRRRWQGEVPTDVVPDVDERDRRRDPAAISDERGDLLSALATLPRGQRAVLVLRFFDDLTETQAAAVLGVSVGTIKSQTARALRTLRASSHLLEQA